MTDTRQGGMRGYFGLGVEGLSKPHNAGALFRTANAFGASFLFGIAPALDLRRVNQTDTSETARHVPLWVYDTPDALQLPRRCRLVGIELVDESIALPSFRHPEQAAYVLGPERGVLSPEMQARCDYLVQIPTAFCVNVGIAGAIVLYDRMLSRGRFAERPVAPGGPHAPLPRPEHGGPRLRRGGAAD